MARSGSNRRKRTHQETFRTDDAERLELHSRAAKAGMPPAAYYRQQCLGKDTPRSKRSATPNEEFIAKILTHLANASDHHRAGDPDAVDREHMMIRHHCFIALEAKP